MRVISIPESELEFSFSRAGGPGGQNVNKVETRVTVLFDYQSSHTLTWEQKGRLGKSRLVQTRLNADGKIAVASQVHRTQSRNKEAAVEKLHELLAAALRRERKRIPTQKTRASERRRLETKRFSALRKVGRKKVRDNSDDT